MVTPSKKSNRILLLSKLLFKDLMRRRVILLMLFILPAVFNIIILITTPNHKDPIVLGALHDNSIIMISREALSFVFLGVAAVCFLTAFFGFYLVYQRTEPDRRLALCGYRPMEIIAAKVAVLVVIVLSIAVYEALMIRPFFEPQHFGWVLAGLFLGGIVYSCYGLLVGAISVHELEGIFLIILLANIDVGWLQNPIYYNESISRKVIERLPGFFPIQLSSAAAFTNALPLVTIWGSLFYAVAFLAVAVLAFWWRIRKIDSGNIRKQS